MEECECGPKVEELEKRVADLEEELEKTKEDLKVAIEEIKKIKKYEWGITDNPPTIGEIC